MNIHFGRYLQAARERRGLSQRQLASATSMHQSDISQMEQGKRLPGFEQLLNLADSLKVPLQWFLTGSNTAGIELPDLAFHLQQLGIADLHVENARVPGSFRHDAETIALALMGNAPAARIIEALPAVLAWNPYTLTGLIAFADLYDPRVKYRLGWFADIALTINAGQGFPGGISNIMWLEKIVREVGYPRDEDPLGFADFGAKRPPVTIRWKIGYPAPLASFRERAERLYSLRRDRDIRKHTVGIP